MAWRSHWRSALSATALTVVVVAIFAVVVVRNRPKPAAYGAGTNDYVGRAAPDFTLTGLDGKSVTLSSLKGNVVVLDLWATWCPPCVEELPTNANVAGGYADRGVKFFAVNLGESPEQVNAFLARQKLTVPVLLDAENVTADKYGANYIPLLVVIDKDGKIVARDNVAPDEVATTLPKWIETALKNGQASGSGHV